MNQKRTLEDLSPDATVEQIVAAGVNSGDLLASIGLDPEKHGAQTLRSVCRKREWSEVEVLKWLKKKDNAHAKNGKEEDLTNDIDTLCAYLQEHYHQKNISLLNEIEKAFPRVMKMHADRYKQLETAQRYFDSFTEILGLYYKFEEKKFFPLAKKVIERKSKVLDGTTRKLKRCFEIIERDQNRLSNKMKLIRLEETGLENTRDASMTLRIMNQNMELLFNSLYDEFEFEQQLLIPKIENIIDSI